MCLCGYCSECTEDDWFCGGNCQYDLNRETISIRPKPLSLLLAAPCSVDVLTVKICDAQGRVDIARNELGYFNITAAEFLEFTQGDNVDLQPSVIIYNYGDPPYNDTNQCPAYEFCKPDPFGGDAWQFEIHTSCLYELYLGQRWGPQQDLMV